MAFEAICPILQNALNEVFKNTAENYRTPVGYIDTLISAENRAGVMPINMSNANGGVRQVGFSYMIPISVNDVLDSRPAVCDATQKNELKEITVNVDDLLDVWAPAQVLTQDDIETICTSDDMSYLARMAMNSINAVNQAMDNVALAQQLSNFGNFYNGTNAGKSVELIKSDDSANIGRFINIANGSMRAIGSRVVPFYIGGDLLMTFAELLDIGCCNAGGINVAAGSGKGLFYYDQGVDTILGQDEFIGMLPGSVQLIQHNRYAEGSKARRSVAGVYEQSTIVDPFSNQTNPLSYDFKLEYDSCTETWKFMIGTKYLPVFMPTDMYPAGSPMSGVNGTLRFLGTSEAPSY